MSPQRRSWLAGLLVVLAPGTAVTAAALERPPFDFSVWPSRVREGEPVTIHLSARGRTGAAAAQYDVYLVWATSERAAFLSPQGAWSPEPVPYRSRVSPGRTAPVTSPWRAGPPGEISLTMVVVPASAHPLIRSNWAFQPVLQWITVRPATPAGDLMKTVLGPLGLGAAAACLLVLLYGRRRRVDGPEG
ncbi:MAG: hypothetical protein HY727_04750 [Candidatus Rokubacteria bacterium]|nr:hypothetical protein [Candidatus Rokubacteria bacterium]